MTEVIEDRVTAHLETIESVYGIKIANRKEVAQWIADRTRSEKTALSITTALNTWVMMNSSSGSINIPFSVLKQVHDNLKRSDKA